MNKICKACGVQDCVLIKVVGIGYFCEDCAANIIKNAEAEGLL